MQVSRHDLPKHHNRGAQRREITLYRHPGSIRPKIPIPKTLEYGTTAIRRASPRSQRPETRPRTGLLRLSYGTACGTTPGCNPQHSRPPPTPTLSESDTHASPDEHKITRCNWTRSRRPTAGK
jgi:hypothetical protein